MKITAIVAAVLASLFFTAPAFSFDLLHSFAGPDGETPAAPLVQGKDGLLYGVAAHGGDFTVLPPDGGGDCFPHHRLRQRSHDFTPSPGSTAPFRRASSRAATAPFTARRPTAANWDSRRSLRGRDDLPDRRGRQRDGAVRLPGRRARLPARPAHAGTRRRAVRHGGRRRARSTPAFRGSCIGSIRRRATTGSCTRSSDGSATGEIRPGSSSRRATGSSTGRRTRAGHGTPASSPGRRGRDLCRRPRVHPGRRLPAEGRRLPGERRPLLRDARKPEATAAGSSAWTPPATSRSCTRSARTRAPAGAPSTNPIEGRTGSSTGRPRAAGRTSTGSYGVVYRLSRTGSLSVLHSFSGADGIAPVAPLSAGERRPALRIHDRRRRARARERCSGSGPASRRCLSPALVSLDLDPRGVVGGSSATAT